MIVNLHQSAINNSIPVLSLRLIRQIKSEGLALIQLNDSETSWHFLEDCEIMSSNIENEANPSKMIALHINSLNSLYYEGSYNYKLQQWRRLYITNTSNICLHLLEDVPESSGQKCLWNACIVLTRYLESQMYINKSDWNNLKVLELGAGAALLSLFSHIVMNASCVCVTEQSTCLEYTKQNIRQNNHHINYDKLMIMELEWGNKLFIDNKPQIFDIIIGCDITFNPNLLDKLLYTIQFSLKDLNSICYLCHDDESCPSARNIYGYLMNKVKSYHLNIINISNYRDYINNVYHRSSIHIWKLTLES